MNLNVHITVRSSKRNPHSIMLHYLQAEPMKHLIQKNKCSVSTCVQNSFVSGFTKPASSTPSYVSRGVAVCHCGRATHLGERPTARPHTRDTQTLHSGPGTFPEPPSTTLGQLMSGLTFPKADLSTLHWNCQWVTTLTKSCTKPNYSTAKFTSGLTQVIWHGCLVTEASLKGAMQFH